MRKQFNTKFLVSRRKFVGTTVAAAAAFSILPITSGCTTRVPPRATGEGVPNSNFGGVQIGTITYSFRSMEGGMDNILKYCVESGISSIELMSSGIEQWCGAPEQFRAPRRPEPAEAGEVQQEPEYTEEEYAEFEKQQADSEAALSEWRRNPPLEKFAELAQMYRNAGVDIHIVKWSPANWSDEDLDYAFRVTQAMGVSAITNEARDDAGQRMGPVAEKYGMYAVFHNHAQFADPEFSIDPILNASPNNMLNFDAGHYAGSTGLNPADFIRENHERIFSLHLKDKTGPNTDPPNTNQVWGQGETPLAEVLLLIKENQWPIYCDIELEYPIPAWSDAVKEVRTCVNYARGILI
ncbi:MAG: sugar phosphate isomerase/epimerase [Bacteroidales bacterium]|nr:sugar phosphate isomerase/epimerase [Bacteroidales bacterium]